MPIYEKTITPMEAEKGYVRAPTAAGALAYSTAKHITIRKLTQAEIIDLACAGAKIEIAGDGAEPAAEPDGGE